MSGGVVVWRSRKQIRDASSTTHAEYVGLYECLIKLMWIKSFLSEPAQGNFIPENCTVKCDN